MSQHPVTLSTPSCLWHSVIPKLLAPQRSPRDLPTEECGDRHQISAFHVTTHELLQLTRIFTPSTVMLYNPSPFQSTTASLTTVPGSYIQLCPSSPVCKPLRPIAQPSAPCCARSRNLQVKEDSWVFVSLLLTQYLQLG